MRESLRAARHLVLRRAARHPSGVSAKNMAAAMASAGIAMEAGTILAEVMRTVHSVKMGHGRRATRPALAKQLDVYGERAAVGATAPACVRNVVARTSNEQEWVMIDYRRVVLIGLRFSSVAGGRPTNPLRSGGSMGLF